MTQTFFERLSRRRSLWYWAPLLAWMAAIFVLSGTTAATIERVAAPVQGYPLAFRTSLPHMVEFGVMAALAYRLLTSYRPWTTLSLWVAVVALTVGYGMTDELHQSFVPGRSPSWEDVAYDSLGAVIGLALWGVAVRTRRRFGPRS